MHTVLSSVKEHFLNPRNVGDVGTGGFTGRAGSLTCGATLRVSLCIDQARRITDARFKAAGCSFLVATASFLTEAIKGELSGEVAALVQAPENTISQALADMPADRSHCATLVCDAVLAAITSYSDSVRHEWHGEEALICTCFCVSETTIEGAIAAGGLRTIAEVTKACNAGGGCRSCYSLIEDMLAEAGRNATSEF
jgi:NifU-like protein